MKKIYLVMLTIMLFIVPVYVSSQSSIDVDDIRVSKLVAVANGESEYYLSVSVENEATTDVVEEGDADLKDVQVTFIDTTDGFKRTIQGDDIEKNERHVARTFVRGSDIMEGTLMKVTVRDEFNNRRVRYLPVIVR
jgi:hypothetical protein